MLVNRILVDVDEGQTSAQVEAAAKHLTRLLPVEATSGETPEEMGAMAARLIAAHFPHDGKPATFAVSVEQHSPVMHLDSRSVTDVIASIVPSPPYKVDLRNPDKTILVIVVGGSCLMSVVDRRAATRALSRSARVHLPVTGASTTRAAAQVPRPAQVQHPASAAPAAAAGGRRGRPRRHRTLGARRRLRGRGRRRGRRRRPLLLRL